MLFDIDSDNIEALDEADSLGTVLFGLRGNFTCLVIVD